MKNIIITYPVPSLELLKKYIASDDFVIVVDKAFCPVLAAKIKIDLVVGDFDSYPDLPVGMDLIILETEKDETDMAYALRYVLENITPSQVDQKTLILGGLGGNRFDHHQANIMLVAANGGVSIINDYNEVFAVSATSDKQVVSFDMVDGQYLSFFANPESVISLSGFKYNLTKYHLKHHDQLCISNQVETKDAKLSVHSGSVLVFISQDK